MDVRDEDTGTPYRVTHEAGLTWFQRELNLRGSGASWQIEQYVITVITQIVALCAGPAWLPPRLRIALVTHPGTVPDELAGIDIEWGDDTTEIGTRDNVMALPSHEASE